MREVNMKAIIKRPGYLLILIFIFLIIDNSSVLANEYYDTERFDVTVNIGADAKCEVNEKISLLMEHQQNGIHRTLPTDLGVHRLVDGKDVIENEHVVYSDFTASTKELHTQTKNKQLMVYIYGDTPVSGYQSFSLNYTRDAGDNSHSNFDDLTLPILPYTWDDDINEANFKITLPETVDPKSVILYAGEYGAKDGTGVSYTVSGKNISGHITEALEPCEGVTLYLRLPKGYFKNAATGRDFLIPDAAAGISAFAIAMILIYRFQKRRKKDPDSSDNPQSILSRRDYRAQKAFRLRSVVILLMLITSLMHAWAMMFAALRTPSIIIGLTIWLFAALFPMAFDTLALYLFLKYRDNETTLIWPVISTIATVIINVFVILFCYTIIHTVVIPLAIYSSFLVLGFAYAFFTKRLRPYRKSR